MQKQALIVIDIQKEYESEGRPYFIHGIHPSLQKAKSVLDIARKKAWPILHVKHLQDGDLFGKTSSFSEYIPGFEPLAHEMEFVKSDYSCFSSTAFEAALKNHKTEEIVVIGYGSTKCCLATIVDGYHRGYRFCFVADASNAKRSPQFDEASLHAHATDILASYCKVSTLAEFEKDTYL